MDRNTGANTGPEGLFQDAIAGVRPATSLSALWANGLTEELLNVIKAAGITPDANNWTQLLQALRAFNNVSVMRAQTSGVWTKDPAGLLYLVRVRSGSSGGGGGMAGMVGGGAGSDMTAWGGGGPGNQAGFAMRWFRAVDLPDSVIYMPGAAGSGGLGRIYREGGPGTSGPAARAATDGGAGGDTTFGNLLVARGPAGGLKGTSVAGAAAAPGYPIDTDVPARGGWGGGFLSDSSVQVATTGLLIDGLGTLTGVPGTSVSGSTATHGLITGTDGAGNGPREGGPGGGAARNTGGSANATAGKGAPGGSEGTGGGGGGAAAAQTTGSSNDGIAIAGDGGPGVVGMIEVITFKGVLL